MLSVKNLNYNCVVCCVVLRNFEESVLCVVLTHCDCVDPNPGGGPIWGTLGGSRGPPWGRFSKRMFRMNSRHRDEAIDTKLDVFL